MGVTALKEDQDFVSNRVEEIKGDLGTALREITTSSPNSPNAIDLVGFLGYHGAEEFMRDYLADLNGLHIAHELIELKQHHEPSYFHSLRTGQKSWAAMKYMAKNGELNLGDRIQPFCLSGIGHDLYKLSVPEEILDKSGKLTEDERKIMDNHDNPETVASMVDEHYLKGDGFTAEKRAYVADLIAHHHPGRNGRPINGHAELITIADHMDAAMLRGGYQRMISPEEFLKYMGVQLSKGVFHDSYAKPFRVMLEEYSREAKNGPI